MVTFHETPFLSAFSSFVLYLAIFGIFVLPTSECRGAEHWLWSKGLDRIWSVSNDPSVRAYGFYLHLNMVSHKC